jgi:hypothetical protein
MLRWCGCCHLALYFAAKHNPSLPSSHNAGEPMTSVTPAFVRTCRAGVCRGRYPKALVQAWRMWDKAHGSGAFVFNYDVFKDVCVVDVGVC